MPKLHLATVFAVLALAGLGISACGGSESTGTESTSTGAGLNADTEKAIEGAFVGSYGKPPTSSPKPEAGKNIWFITLDSSLADHKAPGQIFDAAEALGWNVKMYDGKFSPDTIVTGLRQAIADKADGVMLYAVDCPNVKAGLEDVNKAGIPIVSWEGIDCNQEVDQQGELSETKDRRHFDAQVVYNDPDNPGKQLEYTDFYRDVMGYYQGLVMIGGTDGKAKIIKLKETDIASTLLGDKGFEQALADHCPDCEVVETIEFVGTEIGPPLQQKVSQAISRNPDANAIFGVYDAPTESVAPAVLASGRSDDLFVVGGEGVPSIVKRVADNQGVDAGVGFPVRWESWAGLDAMNHLLAGETPPDKVGWPSGHGVQAYDRERNLPPAGERFDGSVDFESAYLKAWGAK